MLWHVQQRCGLSAMYNKGAACTVKYIKSPKLRENNVFKISFRIRLGCTSIAMYTNDANEMKSSGEADQRLCCLLEFSCLETSMVFTSKVFLGNYLSLA